MLIIGKRFHPAAVIWCGKESLLLILAQSGMYWIRVLVMKCVDTIGMPYAEVLTLAVAVLLVSLVISYRVVKLIRSTFLKILVIPPKKNIK